MISHLFADIRTIRTSYVCENGVMRLRCDQPNILEIHGADYGGAAAFICGNGEGSDEPCALVDKTQIVKSRCDNKPTCTITALGSIFGDPCPGLNKYLNVMYACGKLSITKFWCVSIKMGNSNADKESGTLGPRSQFTYIQYMSGSPLPSMLSRTDLVLENIVIKNGGIKCDNDCWLKRCFFGSHSTLIDATMSIVIALFPFESFQFSMLFRLFHFFLKKELADQKLA